MEGSGTGEKGKYLPHPLLFGTQQITYKKKQAENRSFHSSGNILFRNVYFWKKAREGESLKKKEGA